jgi:hypothetical protein
MMILIVFDQITAIDVLQFSFTYVVIVVLLACSQWIPIFG